MADGMEMAMEGLAGAGLSFDAIIVRVTEGAREAAVMVAEEFKTRAQENASGRPGPNIVSDTLHGGIHVGEPSLDAFGGWEDTVSTSEDAFYAEWVEGGTSHAPAYPFMQPAHDEVDAASEGVFEMMIEQAVGF